MLVARNWILHNKKNLKNSWLVAIKKLFTARTFLLALCRRPYPSPFGYCGYLLVAIPAHAGGHCARARAPHAGASMAMHAGGHALGHLGHLGHGFKLHGHACRWVIWVIVF